MVGGRSRGGFEQQVLFQIEKVTDQVELGLLRRVDPVVGVLVDVELVQLGDRPRFCIDQRVYFLRKETDVTICHGNGALATLDASDPKATYPEHEVEQKSFQSYFLDDR